MIVCAFPRCGSHVEARGLCVSHYQQLMKGIALRPVRRVKEKKKCTFTACDFPNRIGGLCSAHYQQLRAGTKLRPLRPTHKSIVDRFFAKVDRSGSCWVWTGSCDWQGYGKFGVGDKNVMAHRFSWSNAHGVIPEGMLVCHKCDNPPCVNPDHLFMGSQAENVRDMIAKGRGNHPRGENHPRARLSDKQVIKIRSSEEPGKTIALRYGISQSLVGQIRRLAVWRHL